MIRNPLWLPPEIEAACEAAFAEFLDSHINTASPTTAVAADENDCSFPYDQTSPSYIGCFLIYNLVCYVVFDACTTDTLFDEECFELSITDIDGNTIYSSYYRNESPIRIGVNKQALQTWLRHLFFSNKWEHTKAILESKIALVFNAAHNTEHSLQPLARFDIAAGNIVTVFYDDDCLDTTHVFLDV